MEKTGRKRVYDGDATERHKQAMKVYVGKKKQEAEKPDPDADYTDDDEEDYGAGDSYEEPVSTDDTADTDPYEDEILGDDDEDPEEI